MWVFNPMPTAEQVKKWLPRASASTLRLNSTQPPPPVGQGTGQNAPDGSTEPSPAAPAKSNAIAFTLVPGGSKLAFTLPYPPSVNRVWRSIVIKGAVRVLLSSEGRAYKKAVAALAPKLFLLAGPLGIRVRVYRPRRVGDLNNRIKVIEDALQGVAYENDDQIEYSETFRFDDKDNPRVEIEVWNLPHERQGALPL